MSHETPNPAAPVQPPAQPVAPAQPAAPRDIHYVLNQLPPGITKNLGLIVAGLAASMIIWMLLPFASAGRWGSVNFFDSGFAQWGSALVLIAATAGCAALAAVGGRADLAKTGALFGIVHGVIALFVGFFSDFAGLSRGAGSILMGIAGLLLAVSSVAWLLLQHQAAVAAE